jgi:hypothetical protein
MPKTIPTITKARKGLLDALGLSADDYYHGTASNIQEFSKGMRGSNTEAASAKKAFWFSDDPEFTARSYADHSATTNRVVKLLKEADAAERKGDWDLYDQKIIEAEQLEAQFMSDPQARMRGQNIMPIHVPNDESLKVVDMKGQSFNDQGVSDFVNKTIDQAKSDGLKGVKFLNLDDAVGHYDKPATHVAVFDEADLRSKFAELNPAKKGEVGLMKSAKLPTAAAGLMGVNEFNRAERMAEFEDKFALPQGQQRGSILPIITDDEGFVEFGTPQVGVDVLRGLFDIGQSRKTGVVNPTSIFELL